VTEVYASECCGVVCIPGSKHYDDLYEAERGARLVLETEERENAVVAHGCTIARPTEHWQRVHRVTATEAKLYDAIRAGECPFCGEETPGLKLLDDVDTSGQSVAETGPAVDTTATTSGPTDDPPCGCESGAGNGGGGL